MSTKYRVWLAAVSIVLFPGAGEFRADTPGRLALRELTLVEATKRIEQNRGSIVIFHMYASWCPPCRSEFPDINEVARLYSEKKVKVLALSLDQDQSRLRAFLNQNRPLSIEPIVLVAGKEDNALTLRRAGLTFEGAVPYTAVFDPSGKLVRQWSGAKDLAAYEAIVEKLLKSSEPSEAAKDSPSSAPSWKSTSKGSLAAVSLPSWAPYAVGLGVVALVLVGCAMSGQFRRRRN